MNSPRLCVSLLINPVHFFSLGFGSGLSPWAPGTMGTLLAIPLFYFCQDLSLLHYLILTTAGFVLGVYFCGYTAKALGVHDHPVIVWDEIIGYFITMLAAPSGWVWILIGFILFRLFDIWKPWPISWLDKQLKGGLGIMLDDVLAGVFALITIQILALLL